MTAPWLDDGDVQLYHGSALEVLRSLPAGSVQTCVTSPPFFQLRDYGVDGQIGLEATVGDYVERLVEVFRAVRRVLRDDATLWLELGDSYLPGKQLAGVPWTMAFALQADGWVLRSDVVWSRPNRGAPPRPAEPLRPGRGCGVTRPWPTPCAVCGRRGLVTALARGLCEVAS